MSRRSTGRAFVLANVYPGFLGFTGIFLSLYMSDAFTRYQRSYFLILKESATFSKLVSMLKAKSPGGVGPQKDAIANFISDVYLSGKLTDVTFFAEKFDKELVPAVLSLSSDGKIFDQLMTVKEDFVTRYEHAVFNHPTLLNLMVFILITVAIVFVFFLSRPFTESLHLKLLVSGVLLLLGGGAFYLVREFNDPYSGVIVVDYKSFWQSVYQEAKEL